MGKSNALLDLYSCIYELLGSELAGFDELISEADDGESHTLEESREEVGIALGNTIAQLEKLGKDIEKKSLKAIKKDWL